MLATREGNAVAREILRAEQAELVAEANRVARTSALITPEMTAEVKQMLRLFGVPYVDSLAEAEAQCAFLEQASLTQGTITDDNDIFLFGGQTVFRHVCSKKKAVQRYSATDVHKRLCKWL